MATLRADRMKNYTRNAIYVADFVCVILVDQPQLTSLAGPYHPKRSAIRNSQPCIYLHARRSAVDMLQRRDTIGLGMGMDKDFRNN